MLLRPHLEGATRLPLRSSCGCIASRLLSAGTNGRRLRARAEKQMRFPSLHTNRIRGFGVFAMAPSNSFYRPLMSGDCDRSNRLSSGFRAAPHTTCTDGGRFVVVSGVHCDVATQQTLTGMQPLRQKVDCAEQCSAPQCFGGCGTRLCNRCGNVSYRCICRSADSRPARRVSFCPTPHFAHGTAGIHGLREGSRVH